jgi:hypothetical protein
MSARPRRPRHNQCFRTREATDAPRCVHRGMSAIAIGALAFCTSACGDPLVAPELVQGNRVLGARVEADADPGRASVAPTQAATLRWFVVSPDGPPMLNWAVNLCVAEPVSRGLPICAAPSFARYTSATASSDEPRIEFMMADEQSLRGAAQVTANAVFCSSGEPLLGAVDTDPTDARCPLASEEPLLATLGVVVSRDATSNENPSFQAVRVSLDQASWSEWSEPGAAASPCVSLSETVPRVKADGGAHEISLTFADNLSEPIATVSSHSASHETIQLSHFVTAGDLARAFSTVDFAKLPAQVSVTWSAPTKVPADGQLVRFFFVLRDGRGGVDWSIRALCVTP